MIFLLFLVFLSAQDAFCSGNVTYRYTIGFLYERDATRKIIDAVALAPSSDDNFQIHLQVVHVEPDSAFDCLNTTCDLILRYPPVGIFGPTCRINVDTIQSICSARNIPHILTGYVGQLKGETQLNFYPNIKLLTNAYIDILSSMKWEQFTFIYTSANYTPWIKFIEKVQSYSFDYDIEFINLDAEEEATDIFTKLRNTDKKYFVIDCLEEDTMQILSLFQNYGMINKHYHYFFTSIDTFNESISTFKSSGVDITKVQLLNSTAQADPRLKGFSNLPTVSEALIFDAVQVFAQALKNLKPVQNESVNCQNGTQWKDGNLILDYILSNSYMGITGQISFGTDRYRNTSKLFIHKLLPDGMTQVGTWTTSNGVEYIKPSYEKPIPYDWRSKPLVVATSLKEPYVMRKESLYPLEGNDRYQGFAIDLIEELSKIEHFTYNIVVVEGGAGIREMSGNWRGIVGEIVKENADLGILDLTITSDRLQAVEFTHPIMHTGITILFQKPMAIPPRFYDFMRPFSTGLWTAIALSFLAATISLFIVGRLCNSEWQKLNPTSNFNTSQLTFSNTIWFVAGSVFRQNTQVKIRSIPGRIIAAAWWLLCFIVIAMYISALVTHRVKYEDDKDILFSDVKSLVENAEEHGIRYGALKHGATLNFFKTSSVPLYQELYQHMIENEDDLVVLTDEAVNRAETTRYAFFTEKATIDYITEHHCQLMQYNGLINENAHGIAVRPDSPYLTSLNTAILKITDTGKLNELKRKWWNKGICDVEIEGNEVYPLYIVDLLGLIQVTLIGITVAVVSAIVEFLLYVDKQSKKLKITFFKVFKLELKKCFRGNTKKVVDRNLIIKLIPENEEHEATTDIELS